MKDGFVSRDRVKIHYLEAGPVQAEAPALLLVPGWAMPAWIWEAQIQYFSNHHRVVAIDPRSQGQSTQTSEGLYPAEQARDIKAVIDELDLAPFVLVGWSMAVKEVLAYIDQFGTGGLSGVILVDNNAGGFSPGEAEMDLGFLRGILETPDKTMKWFLHNVQFKKQNKEYIERVRHAALAIPATTLVALLVGTYTADYRDVLGRIDKPTLVCAADSPYKELVVEMQERIPSSRLKMFNDAGHALFVDNADEFNTVVGQFIADLK